MICVFVTALCLAAPAVPAQDAPAPDAIQNQVYDVRDLLQPPPRDYAAPRLGLGRAMTEERSGSPERPTVDPAAGDALLEQIRGLADVAWPQGTSVQLLGGQVVVRQTAAAHAAIAAWLTARRTEAGRLVKIETRFLALTSETARRLPARVHRIDPTQAERLIALARDGGTATLLSAPTVTAFNGQRANVLVANQVAYVARHTLRVTAGGLVADPEVAHLTEGIALDVRATREGEGWLRLHVELQRADLLRPIPEAPTRFGPIQVPQVVEQESTGDVRLPDGGWALVAGLHEVDATGTVGRPVVVLVHAQLIELEDK